MWQDDVAHDDMSGSTQVGHVVAYRHTEVVVSALTRHFDAMIYSLNKTSAVLTAEAVLLSVSPQARKARAEPLLYACALLEVQEAQTTERLTHAPDSLALPTANLHSHTDAPALEIRPSNQCWDTHARFGVVKSVLRQVQHCHACIGWNRI
jgi:hypothetical protein